MSDTPKAPAKSSASQKFEAAVGKALDPFASALKRASHPTPAAAPAAPGKPGLAIAPLAGPFPHIPPHGRGRDRHRPRGLLQA